MATIDAADDLTAPFWNAAADRVLVRPVCGDCGRNFFTPQLACPACLGENWSYLPSSGRGKVHSATVVHRAPSPEFDVPYRLVVVDLDEGWSMLATLIGGDDTAPPSGTPVQLDWVEQGGRILPAFRVVER